MTPILRVRAKQDADGRWLATVPRFLAVAAEGRTRAEAVARAKALALRTIADQVEQGGNVPELKSFIDEDTPDEDCIAQAALEVAGQVWGVEDFSDWEGNTNGDPGAR